MPAGKDNSYRPCFLYRPCFHEGLGCREAADGGYRRMFVTIHSLTPNVEGNRMQLRVPELLVTRPESGDIAQLGEHGVRIAEVGGSSPPISTNHAPVAQPG